MTKNKDNKGNNEKAERKERKKFQKGGSRNYNSSRKREQFKKFADNDYRHNDQQYWPRNDAPFNNWNNNNQNNPFASGGAIYPWIRKKPLNPLVVPKQHINFEQCENDSQGQIQSHKEAENHDDHGKLKPLLTHEENEKEPNAGPTAASVTGTIETPLDTNLAVKIKQEKILNVSLKQENKSSSTSSSGETSSEDEKKSKSKILNNKANITSDVKRPSSPLNIRFKAKENTVSQTATKATPNIKPVSECSSSSSSDEDSEPSPPSKSSVTTNKKPKEQISTGKRKNGSEDDVVCMGNLDNRIVLEDESDKEDVEGGEEEVEEDQELTENIEKTLQKLTKLSKKGTEKCMICDKKGHTSFQCQMICKNCSTPYHGYRTCPKPTNLNTAVQFFIEFCMEQFHNFKPEKLTATNIPENVPKPKVDSPSSTSTNNKANNIKRRHTQGNEGGTRNKNSKKRKTSHTKKPKAKTDSDNSSGSENYNSNSGSDTSSTEGNTSQSSDESLVSFKKKRKIKSRNSSKVVPKLPNFAANPVNLPLVLNGFPALTVPTQSVPNTNNSTNALNTLLLTQMFQNAMGSFKH